MDKKPELKGVSFVGDDVKLIIGGETCSRKALLEEVNSKLTWNMVSLFIGIFIALVSLLLSVQVSQPLARMSQRLDKQELNISKKFEQIDHKFERIDHKFELIEKDLKEQQKLLYQILINQA